MSERGTGKRRPSKGQASRGQVNKGQPATRRHSTGQDQSSKSTDIGQPGRDAAGQSQPVQGRNMKPSVSKPTSNKDQPGIKPNPGHVLDSSAETSPPYETADGLGNEASAREAGSYFDDDTAQLIYDTVKELEDYPALLEHILEESIPEWGERAAELLHIFRANIIDALKTASSQSKDKLAGLIYKAAEIAEDIHHRLEVMVDSGVTSGLEAGGGCNSVSGSANNLETVLDECSTVEDMCRELMTRFYMVNHPMSYRPSPVVSQLGNYDEVCELRRRLSETEDKLREAKDEIARLRRKRLTNRRRKVKEEPTTIMAHVDYMEDSGHSLQYNLGNVEWEFPVTCVVFISAKVSKQLLNCYHNSQVKRKLKLGRHDNIVSNGILLKASTECNYIREDAIILLPVRPQVGEVSYVAWIDESGNDGKWISQPSRIVSLHKFKNTYFAQVSVDRITSISVVIVASAIKETFCLSSKGGSYVSETHPGVTVSIKPKTVSSSAKFQMEVKELSSALLDCVAKQSGLGNMLCGSTPVLSASISPKLEHGYVTISLPIKSRDKGERGETVTAMQRVGDEWTIAKELTMQREQNNLILSVKAALDRLLVMTTRAETPAHQTLLAGDILVSNIQSTVVRVLVKQRKKDPRQAYIVVCNHSSVSLVDHLLTDKGFGLMASKSTHFIIRENEMIRLSLAGEVTFSKEGDRIELVFSQESINMQRVTLKKQSKGHSLGFMAVYRYKEDTQTTELCCEQLRISLASNVPVNDTTYDLTVEEIEKEKMADVFWAIARSPAVMRNLPIFARQLKLPEDDIIDYGVEEGGKKSEKAYKVLERWSEIGGYEAKAIDLLNALKELNFNQTADKVLAILEQEVHD